jgi:beta-N-acetylhexosaminidase
MENGRLFGDLFKKILLVLTVVALFAGTALGLWLGLPHIRIDLHRATPEPSVTPTPAATPTPGTTPSSEPTSSVAPQTTEEWVDAYIDDMDVDEKLGQLMMFGFSGTSDFTATYKQVVQSYHVGNLILYGANIKRTNNDGGFALCKQLTGAVTDGLTTDIPPLIAIDVEGGSVLRFRWDPQPVSARSLGRRRDADYAFEQFETIGERLVSVGVNLDLAPVLDVSDNPMDTFLETRIISEDATITAAIGASIIDGLHAANCLSAAKHFPGHGGTTEDSHDTTPVIERTAEELQNYDLLPYYAAIESGVDAIMMAHIRYPALDENDIASMSEPIITGLLRNQMGFDGLVVSDDFRMDGLTNLYSVADAAVQFILAGGDVIVCGADVDRQTAIIESLHTAAEDGRLSEERIDESVKRVLLKKAEMCGWDVAAAVQNRQTEQDG